MTYIKWRNKRPYVYRKDGEYLGTYRDYRHRRPCGTYSQMPEKKTGAAGRKMTMMPAWKVQILHNIDRAARKAWDQSHPKKKC